MKHKHRFSTFIGHGETPAQTANEIRRMMDRGEPIPLGDIADLVERHSDEMEGLAAELKEAIEASEELAEEAEELRTEVESLEDENLALEAENERLSEKENTR